MSIVPKFGAHLILQISYKKLDRETCAYNSIYASLRSRVLPNISHARSYTTVTVALHRYSYYGSEVKSGSVIADRLTSANCST